jgi:hypothetical protein
MAKSVSKTPSFIPAVFLGVPRRNLGCLAEIFVRHLEENVELKMKGKRDQDST